MGSLYVLRCKKCQNKQSFSTSGCMFPRGTSRERAMENMSNAGVEIFKKLEEQFPCEDEDFYAYTSIYKCSYCKALSHCDEFEIKLNEHFTLTSASQRSSRCNDGTLEKFEVWDNWYVWEGQLSNLAKQEGELRGNALYKALHIQWFEDSLCTSCGHVGLELCEHALFD